ncbi:MAG: protein kinase domain-containing protein [Panacagrimonas sp.]
MTDSPISRTQLSRSALAEFERLSELDDSVRGMALAELAAENPVLHRRVQRLLDADLKATSAGFLSGSAEQALASGGDPITSELAAGIAFGAYTLEHPLGVGGMSEVWLGRRSDGLFEGSVAIKTLHAYLSRTNIRERFAREGQILARLSHPHIARLLDVGVSPDGTLFLVIEYVDGQPLNHWCDQRKLDVEARLRLFLDVCLAVSHAHAHQVVHRDLKPSNILVTQDGQVKLLDFGIAKLVENEAAESTELTRVGGRALTPEYAAPEQVLGMPITPVTDVYALGVLLYELLAGARPYGATRSTTAQIERDVVETDPVPILHAVTQSQAGEATPEQRAAERSTVPRQLRGRLAGDLENILGQALKKKPAERYVSVAALAEDVRRHLDNQPIKARSDSIAYRTTKFVRRYRTGVAAAALVLVALITGLSVALWQARVAIAAGKAEQLQRQRAEARESALREVVGFQGALMDRVNLPRLGQEYYQSLSAQLARRLQAGEVEAALPPASAVAALLDQLRPYASLTDLARDTLARQVLQPAQAELMQRFADRPEVEGALLDSLGRSYSVLHLWAEAESAFARAALRHRAREHPDDASGAERGRLDALNSRAERVRMLFRLDRLDEALAEARRLVSERSALPGGDPLDILRARGLEAIALRSLGRHQEALAIAEPLLRQLQNRLGAHHVETLDLLAILGATHHAMSRLPEAERELREAVTGLMKQRDPLHARTISARANLGAVLLDLGRANDARAHLEPLLSELRARFGDEDPQTLLTETNLTNALSAMGDWQAALALERELIETRLRRFGPDDLELLLARGNHAESLKTTGKLVEALVILEDIYARHTRLLGPDHPETLYSGRSLAVVLRLSGKARRARDLGEQVLAALTRTLGANHRFTLEALEDLAISYLDLGDVPKALKLTEAALAAYHELPGVSQQTLERATRNLIFQRRRGGDTRGADLLEATLVNRPTLSP